MGRSEEGEDAVAGEAVTAEPLDGEEELPALAVGRFVPVVIAGLAAAQQGPFRTDG